MSVRRKDKIPQKIISQLIKDAAADPQLPRPNPTEAFWQQPAAEHSTTQSANLPAVTTYAIIGSGITGCSVARNLLLGLPKDSLSTVTVFEARSLTSGATGRNGGHLLSPVPEEFGLMEKGFGTAEATRIGRFANRTLKSMYQLAEDERLTEVAEVRHVRTVTGYLNKVALEEATSSFRRYEECVPEEKGDGEIVSSDEAANKYNLKDTVGAISCSAGAFWPYRLVTGLFAKLLANYEGRFFLETQTPVTAIDFQPQTGTEYPYIITTPRGIVRACKVIHCSNGWTGHLLPRLRGKIFPLRGTMSVQKAGSSLSNHGKERSWSTIDQPKYDAQSETFCYGLYYITQNPGTGDIFIGGENQKIGEILSSDDTSISSVSKETLERILPTIFAEGWRDGEVPEVRKIWSGIMGFTPDHVPWVGRIPSGSTGRSGDGEYIAAGFNGYGMPLCWGCGEAVAKMILGEDVKEWLPESFLITPKRLGSVYSTVESGIALMLGQSLDWVTMARLMSRSIVGALRNALFG